MTRPNGVATTYAYDPASQLTSLVHAVGGAPFASFSYAYDPVGNRTSLTDLDGTHDYAYDALNRLIDATHPQPANPAESFAYDPVGNRTGSHLASSQIHDAANRLLEDSNFTYTYDENGNLTAKTSRATGEVTTYTYDAENQLIRVDRPGTVAEYRYDALGRRIAKIVNGVSTRFVYDNEDMVAEVDSGSSVRALYTHGPSIDEPLAMFRSMPGTNTFLFHADGLGSISHVTSTAGAPTRSYTYDSFGRIVAQTGTFNNPYTYTGRELDPESGLYYYRARYYDPWAGRFLQEDPIGFEGGLNLYSYVQNDPLNFIDPMGLDFISTFRQNWKATNRFFFSGPTRLSRSAIGLTTSGAVARTYGTVTPAQAIRSILFPGATGVRGVAVLGGVVPTLASAALHIGWNAFLSGLALEAGITFGSLISAIPVYDSAETIGTWWGNYLWDFFYGRKTRAVGVSEICLPSLDVSTKTL
jgi:RHS repeat-associated protein